MPLRTRGARRALTVALAVAVIAGVGASGAIAAHDEGPPPPPPPNDDRAAATDLGALSEEHVELGDTTSATLEDQEAIIRCFPQSRHFESQGGSVWYAFTAAHRGTLQLTAHDPGRPRGARVVLNSDGSGEAEAHLDPTPLWVRVGGETLIGEPPPNPPPSGVYVVSLHHASDDAPIACADSTIPRGVRVAEATESSIADIVEGERYLVRVASYDRGKAGTFRIGIAPHAAPANDRSTDAQVVPLTTEPVEVRGTTVGAAHESEEADGHSSMLRRVWYRMSTDRLGKARLHHIPDADDDVHDTMKVGVYKVRDDGTRGWQVLDAQVAEGEDALFQAEPGVEYLVSVGHRLAYARSFTLEVDLPPRPDNDDRHHATPIDVVDGALSGDLLPSTIESDEYLCAPRSGTRLLAGMWYRFTAPSGGTLNLSAHSQGSALLAILETTADGTTNKTCTTTSYVVDKTYSTGAMIELRAGADYEILVLGAGDTSWSRVLPGTFTVELDFETAPGNDDPVAAPQLPHGAVRGTTTGATTEVDVAPSSCGRQMGTVWYRYTADEGGKVALVLDDHHDASPLSLGSKHVTVRELTDGVASEVVCFSATPRVPGQATFDAVAGTSYLVSVSQPDDFYRGSFELVAAITDEVDGPEASVVDAAADEAGGVEVPLRLSYPAITPVVVRYQTVAGSAASGDDFAHSVGEVMFAPGESEKTISVGVIDDALDEHDEDLQVQITEVVGGQAGDSVATATIVDDDAPPAIASADVEVQEGTFRGHTTALFTVELSVPSGKDVTVDHRTVAGTAMAVVDFVHHEGTVTIPAGQTSATVEVAVVADRQPEDDEHLFLELWSAINATIADATAVAAIRDDDDRP